MKIPTIHLTFVALASLAACAPQQSPATPGPTAASPPPILCTPRAASKAGRVAAMGLGPGVISSAFDLAFHSGCEALARTAPGAKDKR